MQSKFSRRIIARSIAAKLLAEPHRQKHWMKVLAAYLLEQRAAEDADLMINDVAREVHLQSGRLYASVSSAHELSEHARTQLKHLLAEATGAQHVELDAHLDKSLLGGFIVRTPDQQLDASVRSKLKRLASIN